MHRSRREWRSTRRRRMPHCLPDSLLNAGRRSTNARSHPVSIGVTDCTNAQASSGVASCRGGSSSSADGRGGAGRSGSPASPAVASQPDHMHDRGQAWPAAGALRPRGLGQVRLRRGAPVASSDEPGSHPNLLTELSRTNHFAIMACGHRILGALIDVPLAFRRLARNSAG